MNFKNAYDYLINISQSSSQVENAETNEPHLPKLSSELVIQQQQQQQQQSTYSALNRKCLQPINQMDAKKSQVVIFQQKQVNVTSIAESKVQQIQLGDNPFELIGSQHQSRFKDLLNSHQSNSEYTECNLEESYCENEEYLVCIRMKEPLKQEVLSFLKLLGEVEVNRIGRN